MIESRHHLLVISAESEAALRARSRTLARFLRANPAQPLESVAATLMLRRPVLPYRRYAVCLDSADAAAWLDEPAPPHVNSAGEGAVEHPIVFMFPGAGSQYVNMARGLFESCGVFRSAFERCSALLKPALGLDLTALVYPAPDDDAVVAAEMLASVSAGLPALFTVEYALAELLASWGVRPSAMIGSSLGEYVAACLAGVFSLEDALRVVAYKGKLLETLPAGAMLTVFLPEREIHPLLGDGLSLAAILGPSLCIVSGTAPAVAELKRQLDERQVDSLAVQIAAAGHSPFIDTVLPRFAEFLNTVKLTPPSVPFVSNLTGRWVEGEAGLPSYWVDHLRHPVRFADGLSTIFTMEGAIMLEVGPGRTLTSLARAHPDRRACHLVLQCVRHARDRHDDMRVLLDTLGQMWLQGCAIDWGAFLGRGGPAAAVAVEGLTADSPALS